MKISQFPLAAYDFWRVNRRKLKPYLLKDGKKHKVAFICPGGAYSMVCSFLEGKPYAKALNAMGYHAVVVYYRCKNRARFPAPMEDLVWAIREVMKHAEDWKIDMDGYAVIGSSAGGHLSASFGTESIGYACYGLPKPGALILCYPVITLGEETHALTRKNLLGSAPTQAEIERVSVEKHVTAAYPPTFLWYGEDDTDVSPTNSELLASALKQAEIPYVLEHYPHTAHGVGLGEGLPCEGWLQRAVAFWEKHRV